MYYSQCLLVNEKRIMVSWIPGSYAEKGKVLQLKKDSDWENGWIVTEVWQTLKEDKIFEWRKLNWRSE